MDIRKLFIFYIGIILIGVGCKSSDEPGGGPTPPSTDDLVKAWHFAKGGGSQTTGGQGGTIYYITNLSDELDPETGTYPVGTFRYAVSRSDSRIIVFKVAGVLHLKSELVIKTGNVTILGQAAPGQGVCIADYPVKIENAENIIIRFMRFRMGDEKLTSEQADGADALSVNNCRNVAIDHCSFSWSTDECVSCYGNENFTLQYCFITEALRISKHDKGAHGYGGIWGGKNASFHHNLLAHHDSRNPRFDHDFVTASNVAPVDYINNVVYNWRSNSAYGGEGSSATGNQRQFNFINNYYKPGPATNSGVSARLLNPTTKCADHCIKTYGGSVVPGKFYVSGNIMSGSSSVTDDNWSGVFPDESSKKSQCKSSTRFTFTNCYTGEQSAADAYETVLAKAGCSFKRDAIDERIVGEVRNGTSTYHGSRTPKDSRTGTSENGMIDTPSDVGGWPDYTVGESPVDTDGDGMPDEWEKKYGLNPNLLADARQQTLVKGYTNLELCLSDLVKDLY